LPPAANPAAEARKPGTHAHAVRAAASLALAGHAVHACEPMPVLYAPSGHMEQFPGSPVRPPPHTPKQSVAATLPSDAAVPAGQLWHVLWSPAPVAPEKVSTAHLTQLLALALLAASR